VYYEAVISEVAVRQDENRHNNIFKEMKNWVIYENFRVLFLMVIIEFHKTTLICVVSSIAPHIKNFAFN
jgi:hypothetical protein